MLTQNSSIPQRDKAETWQKHVATDLPKARNSTSSKRKERNASHFCATLPIQNYAAWQQSRSESAAAAAARDPAESAEETKLLPPSYMGLLKKVERRRKITRRKVGSGE